MRADGGTRSHHGPDRAAGSSRSGSSSDPRAALPARSKQPLDEVLEAWRRGGLEDCCSEMLSPRCRVCFWENLEFLEYIVLFFGCTPLPVRVSHLKLAVQESSFCLTGLFSPIQELKEPLADIKSQLDATAFDIQFLISEHAQDLTPQQSRQLLRLLNELQKAFRDLSERVTAQVEVLQVCLQQVEQTDQVKVVRHQLPGCSLLAEALPGHKNVRRDTSYLGFHMHATHSL